MKIDNPNFLLSTGFYQNNLVATTAAEEESYELTGSNQKQLTIVYQKSTSDDAAKLAYLGKIISAVKYDLSSDAALIGLTPKETLSFRHLQGKMPVRHFISFGIAPAKLGLNINAIKYQVFSLAGTQFLLADTLDQIEKDKNLKGGLWTCLQQMFLQP